MKAHMNNDIEGEILEFLIVSKKKKNTHQHTAKNYLCEPQWNRKISLILVSRADL